MRQQQPACQGSKEPRHCEAGSDEAISRLQEPRHCEERSDLAMPVTEPQAAP